VTAKADFEKVLSVYPDNPDALKALGSIFQLEGNTEQALANFKKVTEINPRDVQVSSVLPNSVMGLKL
jgi:lipoprotein NlpI